MMFGEEIDELRPVEREVAALESLRERQQHGRTAFHRHVAVRHRTLQRQRCRCAVQVRGILGKMLGGNEAEVIVPMWNLPCATGVDDIHLRGDLVTRAQPRLAGDGKRVVGVVVGEHLRGMQRELLRGVPDPVVGAGLAEVVAGCIAGCMLRIDDREERLAGPVHHAGGERVLEDHHAGPIGQRPDQFGLQRPAVGGTDGGCGVNQHVASQIGRQRVVGEIGVAQHLCAEVVEPAVGLVDPRFVCRAHGCGHGS